VLEIDIGGGDERLPDEAMGTGIAKGEHARTGSIIGIEAFGVGEMTPGKGLEPAGTTELGMDLTGLSPFPEKGALGELGGGPGMEGEEGVAQGGGELIIQINPAEDGFFDAELALGLEVGGGRGLVLIGEFVIRREIRILDLDLVEKLFEGELDLHVMKKDDDLIDEAPPDRGIVMIAQHDAAAKKRSQFKK